MRWFWQKKLPQPMYSGGSADIQIRRNRARRREAEENGEPWLPRGATEEDEEVDLGGGIVIRNVAAAKFLPLTPALRQVAQEDYSAFRGGQTRGINVKDGPLAVERIPSAAVAWSQVRAFAPKWKRGRR